MKPTTAVIFAAGTGTRMLPITSAVQKELLPVLNRPVIDYNVADLVAGGITRIIFVIRPGETGLKDYYLGNPDYESALRRLGKTQALAELDRIHSQAKFEFIEQPESAGYGTAIPLQTAMPLLDNSEPVIVCGGEDFIWHEDGTGETKAFVDTYIRSGAAGAIMAIELPENQLHHYGVLSVSSRQGNEYLSDIVEKPAAEAPSRLANITKYIVNGPIRDAIMQINPRADLHESYITDGLVAAAKTMPIVVHHATGEYLDTGNPEGWLEANRIVAKRYLHSR